MRLDNLIQQIPEQSANKPFNFLSLGFGNYEHHLGKDDLADGRVLIVEPHEPIANHTLDDTVFHQLYLLLAALYDVKEVLRNLLLVLVLLGNVVRMLAHHGLDKELIG